MSDDDGSMAPFVRNEPKPRKPAPTYVDDDTSLSAQAINLAAGLCSITDEDELTQIIDRSVTSKTMLKVLQLRGGHPGALAEAALLCAKKSEDYNNGQTDMHVIDRTGYFPFGTVSYAQMLHTKSARFVSLTRKLQAGASPNFEGLRDTALDIINYSGFYLADNRLINPQPKGGDRDLVD